MSVWSGAGVPVVSGRILSGSETVVFKGAQYIVEHQTPALEGGIIENLGGPVTMMEIHGITYESGADQVLATLSGLIGKGRSVVVPSFISGYYFLNADIVFEEVRFNPDPGFGYPHYHWSVKGSKMVDGAFDPVSFDRKPLFAFDTKNEPD